nr:hypothetical protein [Photorhabdus stackebrandtii]
MRVDKATAVAGDTGGVSDNHFRFAASHFDPTIEVTGIATVDFIEDNFRFPSGEPGVTGHHPTELRLSGVSAVIEDNTLFIHIKLTVAIVGNPISTGCLDIDLRCAIGTVNEGRLLMARRLSIRHDIGLSRQRYTAEG